MAGVGGPRRAGNCRLHRTGVHKLLGDNLTSVGSLGFRA